MQNAGQHAGEGARITVSVTAVGGTLELDSAPREGTRVRGRIPARARADA